MEDKSLYTQILGIQLRQSYQRLSKKTLARQGRYSHAKQMKRARKMTKQLKTYLGRVYRDIQRKAEQPDGELKELLSKAEKLLSQKRNSKNKRYSVHAPEVECISRGKVHKRYEFGCKVGMATTSRDNWIVGIGAFHGNPYDGHTLQETLDDVKSFVGWDAKHVNVDLGFRRHNYQGNAKIQIVNYRTIKKLTRQARMWIKRRAAIEPIFGHLKTDNRMGRNYLKGQEDDQINALLCGCGFNLRKLLAIFFLSKYYIRSLVEIIYRKVLLTYRAEIDLLITT